MKTVGIILALIIIGAGAFVYFYKTPQNKQQIKKQQIETEEKQVDVKASFTIITSGITRSFKNPKYHQRSANVFLLADDPTIVHVKRSDMVWTDFFNTLPMKLTKQCLTTGDGETFCDGENGTLKFYLNGIEDKDLLDKEINNGDKALIEFKSS